MMKKTIFFLLINTFCFSQVFQTVPVIQNGSNDKRINIAVLGDGFTTSDQNSFMTAAQSSANYLLSQSPYAEYKNYFNVYAVKVISAETGVKHPGTATDVTEPEFPVSNPDNYFGSSFDFVDIHRCIYTNNENKIAQVLATNVPDYDISYILANSTEYGGCAGTYAFASLESASNEITVHEMGHSFASLADEYWAGGGYEAPNQTQNSNLATNKWKNWVGLNSVGIYVHVDDPTASWYKPHNSCGMEYLGQQFCSVCKEAIIEKIHSLVSAVDSYTPANNTVIPANSNLTFTVNEILPIPNTLVNSWKLNGVALASTDNSVIISPNQLNNGNNSLLFSVTDNSSLLKVDNHSSIHFTNITWTLSKATLGTTEVKAEERRFSIYPNPANHEFYIKGKQDFSKNITVNIYDASGKLVPIKFELKDSSTIYVDISNLLTGIYTLHVTENKVQIISQKISKE